MSKGKFAAATDVSVARTRVEIEELIQKYGADQTMIASNHSTGQTFVGFTMSDRQVRFSLPMPDPKDRDYTHYRHGSGNYLERSEDSAKNLWEQACRSRWRALLLVIKAKLEAVEVGISTFEAEFLANIVMPNGSLVGEMVQPRIADAYKTGKIPNLLPDMRGD